MVAIVRIITALIPSPTEIVISLAIIGVGIIAIPALAYLKLVFPKGMAGRILWTIGAIVLGPYALIQEESGSYAIHAIHRKDDETIYADVDADFMEIEEVPENWSRLGKRPFLIAYEKSERLFRDVLSNVDEAVADGGVEGKRGGYPTHIPTPSGDGYQVRIHRLLERLREAGGSRLADIAEEEGLREFGGNYDMSNWVLVTYMAVMALLGALAGLWFVS